MLNYLDQIDCMVQKRNLTLLINEQKVTVFIPPLVLVVCTDGTVSRGHASEPKGHEFESRSCHLVVGMSK